MAGSATAAAAAAVTAADGAGSETAGERPGRRRYLAYSGVLTNMIPPHYQSSTWISAALLHLVAMALVTGRILVLPPVFYKDEYFASYEWTDLQQVLRLVEWREASFLQNPRIQYGADTSFARVEFSDAHVVLASIDPATGSLTQRESYANAVPLVEEGATAPREKVHDHRMNMWAALTGSATLRDADVVYVGLDDRFEMYEEACWYRKSACQGMHSADPTLAVLYDALSWCEIRDGYLAKERKEKRFKPTYDCKSRTDMFRDVRLMQKERAAKKAEERKAEKEGLGASP